MRKYFRCACCGNGFWTEKPQDVERDTGYGTCEDCHDRVAKSWVKYGFTCKPINMAEATLRLATFA